MPSVLPTSSNPQFFITISVLFFLTTDGNHICIRIYTSCQLRGRDRGGHAVNVCEVLTLPFLPPVVSGKPDHFLSCSVLHIGGGEWEKGYEDMRLPCHLSFVTQIQKQTI